MKLKAVLLLFFALLNPPSWVSGTPSRTALPIEKETKSKDFDYELSVKWSLDFPDIHEGDKVRFFTGEPIEAGPLLVISTNVEKYTLSGDGKIVWRSNPMGGDGGDWIDDISVNGDTLTCSGGDEAGGCTRVLLKDKNGKIIRDLAKDLTGNSEGHGTFTVESFTPDGKKLLIGGPGGLFAVSTADGFSQSFPYLFPSHMNSSRDGNLWCVNYPDHLVGIVDVKKHQSMSMVLPAEGEALGCGFSADDKKMAVMLSDFYVGIFNVGQKELLKRIQLPSQRRGSSEIVFLDDNSFFYADANHVDRVDFGSNEKVVSKVVDGPAFFLEKLDDHHVAGEAWENGALHLNAYDQEGKKVDELTMDRKWNGISSGTNVAFWKNGKIIYCQFVKKSPGSRNAGGSDSN